MCNLLIKKADRAIAQVTLASYSGGPGSITIDLDLW
jgi:hypothetical protein